jgi:hypothetical protein
MRIACVRLGAILLISIYAVTLLYETSSAKAASDFVILIEREKPQGQITPGQISVNDVIIGRTYENTELLILPGQYQGVLRYVSHNNFVQGPMGKLGKTGDFLLEVSGAHGRTDILFHGGNKPYQSTGCIMLGPVGRDPATLEATVGPDHPLRKLRKLFYGTDTPNSTPDKNIIIRIQ